MEKDLLDIVLPRMGESVVEATLLKWLKKEGDLIKEGDSIAEISTDKVDSEIPSTYSGTIDKILVKENSLVKVGETIALIRISKTINITEYKNSADNIKEVTSQIEIKSSVNAVLTNMATPTTTIEESDKILGSSYKGRFYSPVVRKIIANKNLSKQEIDLIPGTGLNGRVTKEDLDRYLAHKPINSNNLANNLEKRQNDIKKYIEIGDEVITMDRVRNLIAEKMLESKNTIPHVTSFTEADVTNLVTWVSSNKEAFFKKYQIRLTYTALFVEFIAKVIKEIPILNSIVIDKQIIKKKRVNIGIAVALPDGNLIVPVIKDADEMNLANIAIELNRLVKNARNKSLSPDDITQGTYTITNLGSFNNIMGTPIIMKPQVGIMGIGMIRKQPGVISGPNGDYIDIIHKLYLSHSFDHRVIDGAIGGYFVARLAEHLENFDLTKSI
jgi:2-oxoglutarate dehydrogenase E2 component (dihydrolipoamide succinyltransferase)